MNESPPLSLHKTDAPQPVAPMFHVKPESLKEIAQGLLTAMSNARSIESGTTAFMPLASDGVRDKLLHIAGHAAEIHRITKELYDSVALAAFGS